MSYLTDKEKRLLFSALSREKEVCKQVDRKCCREPYEDTLQSVVDSLERKFYYDRFEKKIRNDAIQDFYDEILNFEDYIEPINTTEFGEVLLYSGKDITKMIVKIKEELTS